MSVLLNDSNEPITGRAQLVAYFAAGSKPKDKWLIGVEHEKFPYHLADQSWPSYAEPQGMRAVMQGLQAFGWQPIMEGETLIGLTRGKTAISFEPGGQLELGGAPLATLNDVATELEQHLQEACGVAEKLGIGFLGVGFHPTAKRDEIPWVPKNRYKIMRAYMPKVGKNGLDMMLRTCTVQVNLDYADEADMMKKFRLAMAIQPVATALFASSSFAEGKPNGFNSYRMQMWEDTDNARSGPLEFAFESGFGFERYADYALDVPMYFVYRDGQYIDCTGQSFRAFMDGKLPALPGEKPNMTDWANHLTTCFPDVRLKKIIEMRGADTGSHAMLNALPAFWVGLLYDSAALDAAWDMVKSWKAEDRKTLHHDVLKQGLRAKVAGQTAQELAKKLLEISAQGLQRRSKNEGVYLEPLNKIAASGQNRADELLKQFGAGAFHAAEFFKSNRLMPNKA